MARNAEKANAMLNRFLAGKTDALKGPKKRRPYLATECRDLNEADKWRQEILREIGKKVMEIQNAALGEHRLRDLNDDINKLIREKGHWEKRIVDLGGPNYAKQAPKGEGDQGMESERGPGYRYFGAAKTLPGVKELFENQGPRTVRRTRHQMNKAIDADYYGFRDEEDGVLERVERSAEAELRAAAIAEYEAQEADRAAVAGSSAAWRSGNGAGDVAGAEEGAEFVAHVPLPDAAVIESMVMDKKKRDLLSKYVSPEVQAVDSESKELLNKKPRKA